MDDLDAPPSPELHARISRRLLVETPLEPADLLFAFGTRHGVAAFLEVIEDLWRRRLFRWAVASGGPPPGGSRTEAAELADGMLAMGIPPDRIIREEAATNTGENVILSLPLIEQHIGLANVRSVIAVGKYYTSARYLMTLERHWPGVAKMFAPVHLHPHPPGAWDRHPALRAKVLREWRKLGPYLDAGFLAPWPQGVDPREFAAASSPRLVPVAVPEHWAAYHAIRREVLFERRGLDGYDADHPDDRAPANHPLLLIAADGPVGTVRLDQAGDGLGVVRMVAIRATFQRQGLGRTMLGLVEAYARDHGCDRLEVNSAPDAVPFYLKAGFALIDATRESPLLGKTLER